MEEVARQLRKPEGPAGLEMARRMNESNRALTEAALAELALNQGERLLEVGPGNASLTMPALAAHRHLHYTGLDYAPDMIAEAKRLHVALVAAGRAKFVQGVAEAMPFTDASFDRALSVNTLYFSPDPAQALAEYARVLRPGGILVLGVRAATYMRQLPFTYTGFRLFEEADLVALLAGGPWARAEVLPFEEQMRTSAAGHVGPALSHLVVAIR